MSTNPAKKTREGNPMEQLKAWRTHFETRLNATTASLREPTLGAVRHAVGSGKRLRPLMALACFEACAGGRDAMGPELIDAAIAVELIHKASLAQDDLPCMDADDERDGASTVHAAFSPSDAVLASDAMIALAFRLVSRLPEGGRCVEIVSEAIITMCRGQAQDLQENKGSKDRRWSETCDAKTGALFVAAARLGVAASGLPSESLMDVAQRLGLAFGRLYQLRDDATDADTPIDRLGVLAGHAYDDLAWCVSAFPNSAPAAQLGSLFHRPTRSTTA